MNQPSVLGNATHTADGTEVPETRNETTPTPINTANCNMATTPMPSTLPASSTWARTCASRISTTALVFSSTTPVSTIAPNVFRLRNSRIAASVPTSRPTSSERDCETTVVDSSGGAITAATTSGLRLASCAACCADDACHAAPTTAAAVASTDEWNTSWRAPASTTTSTEPSRSARSPAARSGSGALRRNVTSAIDADCANA